MKCILKCSYVLASYAKFLWDAGDEDESEEDEVEITKTNRVIQTNMKVTNFQLPHIM